MTPLTIPAAAATPADQYPVKLLAKIAEQDEIIQSLTTELRETNQGVDRARSKGP